MVILRHLQSKRYYDVTEMLLVDENKDIKLIFEESANCYKILTIFQDLLSLTSQPFPFVTYCTALSIASAHLSRLKYVKFGLLIDTFD